jgi:hypothetical protein
METMIAEKIKCLAKGLTDKGFEGLEPRLLELGWTDESLDRTGVRSVASERLLEELKIVVDAAIMVGSTWDAVCDRAVAAGERVADSIGRFEEEAVAGSVQAPAEPARPMGLAKFIKDVSDYTVTSAVLGEVSKEYDVVGTAGIYEVDPPLAGKFRYVIGSISNGSALVAGASQCGDIVRETVWGSTPWTGTIEEFFHDHGYEVV